MARCPFAVWRPLPENTTEPRIGTPTQYILHSAVDAPGPTNLHGYFARESVTVESHFWVRLDGTIEQFLDTERQADANYHANGRAVSVETEDEGNPNERPWTPAQVESLVRLGVWLEETHGIPAVLCPAHDKPGIGYHSMWGAPSEWTPVRGKTCPGTVRKTQVPGIVRSIAQRVRGSAAPAPAPAPAPSPTPAPAPAPTPKPAGPRILRRGDSGADVREMQVALNAKGLARLKADGDFGPTTEAALKAAQRKLGVPADGVYGPTTRRRLAAYRKPANPTLKRGARGVAVERLQALLGIRADGIFGDATHRAVCDFQRRRGFHPSLIDGIVGPKTWAALEAAA